jgi:hypothetical protein
MAGRTRTTRSRTIGDGQGGAMAARKSLARLLRQTREAAKATQVQAAAVLDQQVTKMHKLENGLPGARLTKPEIDALARLYKITDPEIIRQMETLAAAIKVKGPYQPYKDVVSPELDMYLGLETDATSVTSYDNELLPGLLQTEAYARAIIALPGGDGRPRSDEEIDKRVRLRLQRQQVLTRERNPLTLDAILSDTVLRRIPGDHELAIEQLRHLNKIGKLRNVTIRIAPADAGIHLGCTTGQFIILHFPGDEPPFVFSDGYLGHSYWKEEEEIERYEEAFADVSKHALNAKDSRAFIEGITREHEC